MANKKYLDNTGLSRMWSRIKSWINAQNYATQSALTSGLSGKANSSHTHTYSQITNLSTWKTNNFGSGSYSNSGSFNINNSRTSVTVSPTYGIKVDDSFAWWSQTTNISNSWLDGALITTTKATITELNVSDSTSPFEGIVPEDERIYTTSILSGKQYIKTYGSGNLFTTLIGSNRSESITTKVNYTGSSSSALYLICYLFSNSNSNGKISGPTVELYVIQNGNSTNLSFSKGQTRLITGIVGYKV